MTTAKLVYVGGIVLLLLFAGCTITGFGTKQVTSQATCPSDKEISAQINKCKDTGYLKKTNDKGCIVVSCKPKEEPKKEVPKEPVVIPPVEQPPIITGCVGCTNGGGGGGGGGGSSPAGDTTAPVINLLGNSTINLEVGTTYSELGATALDNVDGNLTAIITINSSSVNTNVVGLYSVTYTVSDVTGNSIQITRGVNVVDTIAPVLTLTGNSTITSEVGNTYTELGAGVTDNYNTGLTANITGTVNTNVMGTYTVNYNAKDSSGNAATQLTRTINVVDTTVPVITLTGSNTVIVELGSIYSESGATVSDNYDTGLTATINSSSINTNAVGTYTVTYDATDSSSNHATQKTRTINVVDTTSPVITAPSDITQEATSTLSVVSIGTATATDLSTFTITNNAPASFSVGNTVVIWNATDAHGNFATATQNVNVQDTTPPTLTATSNITQEATSSSGATATYIIPTATDLVDGTDSVSCLPVSGSTFALGTTVVTCTSTDSNSNTATSTFNVKVQDTTPPAVTLLGINPQTVEVGSSYSESGATVSDNYDTGLTVTISGTVNANAVGTYVMNYDVTDSSGNSAVTVTRTINVVDTIAPVITLLGTSPINVTANTTYTDVGATALDNVDGDITVSIVTFNQVDVNTLGTYLVTYNVNDSALNPAIEVTRTVNVIAGSCMIPIDGMNITGDTTFCAGTYNLPNGISIDADNVVLDCNNAQFVGASFVNGTDLGLIGIQLVDRKNVTIENCNLHNYSRAIQLWRSNNNHIYNNHVKVTSYGIELYQNSNHNIIESNNVTASDEGIFANGIGGTNSFNVIKNNIAYSNAYGIEDMESNGTEIYDNVLNNNDVSGIFLPGTSNALVYNNVVYGLLKGIDILSGKNCQVWNNSLYLKGITDNNEADNVYCVSGIGNIYLSGASGPVCTFSLSETASLEAPFVQDMNNGNMGAYVTSNRDITVLNFSAYPGTTVLTNCEVKKNVSGVLTTVRTGAVTNTINCILNESLRIIPTTDEYIFVFSQPGGVSYAWVDPFQINGTYIRWLNGYWDGHTYPHLRNIYKIGFYETGIGTSLIETNGLSTTLNLCNGLSCGVDINTGTNGAYVTVNKDLTLYNFSAFVGDTSNYPNTAFTGCKVETNISGILTKVRTGIITDNKNCILNESLKMSSSFNGNYVLSFDQSIGVSPYWNNPFPIAGTYINIIRGHINGGPTSTLRNIRKFGFVTS